MRRSLCDDSVRTSIVGVGSLRKALRSIADSEKAKHLARFFKTGPGEYGHGDRFLGVMVPSLRDLSRKSTHLPLEEVESLLQSPYNEERLLSLLIWVHQFHQCDKGGQREIFQRYVKHLKWVNNWNLVDASAPYIPGVYLLRRSREPLHQWVRSKNLWKRRIAIVSTLPMIREEDFGETLKLSEVLLGDQEDLIHKACGWMLREVGKRNIQVLETFLDQYSPRMPRTMLRYAIERFSEKRRQHYLFGEVRR